MLAVFQYLNLPQPRHRQPVAVVGLDLQPLERHHLARRQLPRPRHPPVRALLDVVELVVVLDAPRPAEPAALEPQELRLSPLLVAVDWRRRRRRWFGREPPPLRGPFCCCVRLVGLALGGGGGGGGLARFALGVDLCLLRPASGGRGGLLLLLQAFLEFLLFLEGGRARGVFFAVGPPRLAFAGHCLGGRRGGVWTGSVEKGVGAMPRQ